MATIVKDKRLELRVAEPEKRLFEAAAAAKSMSLSQWAVSALSSAARQDLDDARTTTLSAEEFDAFAAALEEPLPAGARELLEGKPVWEK